MRVAVVGAGISGIAAALALAPKHETTLYEKDARLGGHAHTHTIHAQGTTLSVDTGFMVFNPPRYPEFVRLLEYLEVPHVATAMTFSVSIPGIVEYSSVFPRGLFAEPANCLSPRFLGFVWEIGRFNRLARRALATGIDSATELGDFLTAQGFSERVRAWYIFPMLAAIWSCESARVIHFPALAVFRFLDNHGLLSFYPDSSWRTIPGGSLRYVDAARKVLVREGARIAHDHAITAIRRSADSVVVVHNDSEEAYDYVVIATHADTALSLLADPSEAERDILGAFSYTTNLAVLHGDTALMPQRRAAWAAWNYMGATSTGDLSVTYNMNTLQHLPTETPLYVSLNPTRAISDETVYARMTYTHPRFDLAALRAQERLPEIQNKRRTLFAGAHWGYGFHEDGVASGSAAAALLGATPPWKE